MNLYRVTQVSLVGIHKEDKPFENLAAALAYADNERRANGAVHVSVNDLGEAVKLNVEVTDTYGGEANYSWVHRHEIWVKRSASAHSRIRVVKRHTGWNGIRTDNENYGDGEVAMRPRNMCQIMFIRPDYEA